jgi:hypothetical protein
LITIFFYLLPILDPATGIVRERKAEELSANEPHRKQAGYRVSTFVITATE